MDMFSFGMSFHMLLTGTHIYKAKNRSETILRTKICEFNFEKYMYRKVPS
jgi:hypothetical protein